jgi:lipopolysaccharide biosynthesis glycosyltransferase
MNLAQFRKNRIEERFIELIREHDFDLLDPDQAYLNYLCAGRIRELPNGWNLTPLPTPCEGEMRIVHYALYKKPWQYDDVLYGEHFWNYAKRSPFYPQICRKRQSFGGEEQAQKEAGAREILLHALRIVDSEHTFSKILCRA